MASRLEQILADVQARVAALVPATPAVTFVFGAHGVDEAAAPPRVVWERANDEFGAAAQSSKEPRAAATCMAGVLAHVWGKDDTQAESLRDALVVALLESTGASFQVQAASWKPDAQLADGACCVVAFSVAMPVMRPVQTTVAVTGTALDPTGAVAGDGVMQGGEG